MSQTMRAARPMFKDVVPLDAPLATTPDAPAISPTEAAKVQRRLVYEAVEAGYDDKRKCYRATLNGNNSDAAIATRIGCAEALVIKVREEFFGPATAAEPVAAIADMQKEIAYLTLDAEKLEGIAKGLGIQVKEHRQKVGVLSDRLKAMCAEFGWGFSS